jgi:hypothetical protein
VLAWLLVACLFVQVFLAGVSVFSDPTWWTYHRNFVHVFEGVPLLLGILALVGAGRAGLVTLSFGLVVMIGLQYAFAGARPSIVAGLHTVNALLIFWAALALAGARRSDEGAAGLARIRPAWR